MYLSGRMFKSDFLGKKFGKHYHKINFYCGISIFSGKKIPLIQTITEEGKVTQVMIVITDL